MHGIPLGDTSIGLSVRRLARDESAVSPLPWGRHIPLSNYALRWLAPLVRMIDSPYVFVRVETRQPWRDSREPFAKGKRLADLEWVGLHDLRHFRPPSGSLEASICEPSRSFWATQTSTPRCDIMRRQ